MNNFNVKHTTNNGEILTTSCKKLVTALRRFTAFLKEYDRYYNEMLSEINSENTTATRDTCDSETVEMTLTSDTGTYTLTIKHNVKTPDTVWSICTQEGTLKDFTDRKELFKYAYENNLYGDYDEVWIEEKELKDSEHKYYETVDYESLELYHVRSMLEFDICDMKIYDANTTEAEAEQTTAEQTTAEAETKTTKQPEHNKKYIVRVFKNEIEIMMMRHYFPKREYAIDYINKLSEKGVVSRDVVFTINNRDIYDCFSDVKMTGATTQIKLATDTLNEHYKRLCNDISFEYKMRIADDIDVENKDYYANLNTYATILKNVLTGNHSRVVIRNKDKFEKWGNVYRTAMNFILAYNDDKFRWVIKHLESKLRRELFKTYK